MYTYMYMGKNYTLYIKDSRLDKESNKSGLINDLLAQHYEGLPAPEMGVERKVKERVVIEEAKPRKNHGLDPAFESTLVTCKHGADPQFCKFSKPGKPCK